MIDLPLVFVGGLLGSSHCLGMCGPFALVIAAPASGFWPSLTRQLLYSLGRIFTYAAAGAAAGLGGWQLTRSLPPTLPVQTILAIFAGAVLIVQGLASAGVWNRLVPRFRWIRWSGRPTGCLGRGLLRPFLEGRSALHALLAGVLTGFMPCGLVYSFLALAGSTGRVTSGLLLMATFGAGTAPALMLLGIGGSWLGLAWRGRLVHTAAWCVVLTGVVSVCRGVGYLPEMWGAQATGCPLCH